MRTVPLNNGMVALVDDNDFERVAAFRWTHLPNGRGYAYRSYRQGGKSITVYMHRFILDAPRGRVVDHINDNSLDNRRENLRLCTNAQNTANKQSVPGSASSFKGVTLDRRRTRKRWNAGIHINGKHLWLGSYEDEADAARAYDEAALFHYGEFARLNFYIAADREQPRAA